ncbi:DUF4232 domain-containing protein [Rhodanobacter glycinis]|uniref:DUF4232 domain-containing protein n=1 Tax=Rhodanobacter glycinis TaxID=582702 RepID=A0A1I4FQC5_9GAMM|nr:DUF4232 domain-containing protein [Rhodanobacter glycinis]SFL20108.1 Protein of unknown function [Rhodanobacter glycinis]
MALRNRFTRSFPTVLAASLPLLAISACSPHSPATATTPVAVSVSAQAGPCSATQLALGLDGGDGRFNGMSHSGTMLVLRNHGKAPCTMPARPLPQFTDSGRQPLDIVMQAPVGMHPGPVLLPVVVPPGATVTSDMRWVSGNVYDHGHCESPAFITLKIGKEAVSSAFSGHLCGAGGKPSSYSMTPFRAATTHP